MKRIIYKTLIILILILDLMAITKPTRVSCEGMKKSYRTERCDNYVDLFFIALASERAGYNIKERKIFGNSIRNEVIRVGAFGIWF